MSKHTATSHKTWKEHGARTQQRRNDRRPEKGMPDNKPKVNDWEEADLDMHTEPCTPPTVRTHRTAPTCVRVTHVNVHVFTLQGVGEYVGHATNEWRLLRMMEDRRIMQAGGCSVHGTLGKTRFSGCISTHDISKVLATYR